MTDYFESGFSVRQPMWHGKGNVLTEYPENWAAARIYAGLEWDVVEFPTFEFRGVDAEGNPTGNPNAAIAGDYFQDDDRKRIVRSDTGKTLAVVNKSYSPISHEDMGSVVDAILETPNVRYETAGAIEEGKGVWALALMDEPVTLKGAVAEDNSITLPYLALLTRHDAGGAFSLMSTAVRVVCANTWKAAELESSRNGTTYRFKHTKNWKDRIEEAKRAITGARDEFAEYCKLAEELLSIPVTQKQAQQFINAFIPEPPAGLISDRQMSNVKQARAHIEACLYSQTTAEVSHTAYGLVQAAGEYADHVQRARTWETRLGRHLLGVNDVKQRASKIVKQLVTA